MLMLLRETVHKSASVYECQMYACALCNIPKLLSIDLHSHTSIKQQC